MFLFEQSPSYRSRQIGARDTAARFIRDLATAGVPITLASVKAASDVVTAKVRTAAESDTVDAAGLPLMLPIGPLAGLPS